jgi:outer membrane immunogenic protein
VTTNAVGIPVTNTGASETRNGATVGIGGEWGFAPNWSAKLEYDYVALDTANFPETLTTIATGVSAFAARSGGASLNVVKVGISYRFSPHI